jgi:hypothetical protein
MRSALKQRVGAILAKHGIARPYSNLFGPDFDDALGIPPRAQER